ncbi:MAG: DUF6152 family protein [Steroidobacteraceae bacterium]
MKTSLLIAAAVAVGVAATASAHHSFAMFAMDKQVTLKGTVRTWEWTNPHSWLWVYVTEVDGKPVSDKDGNPVIWGLEGTAPGELMRQGINNKSLKAGDKITVTARPLKDGRNGGSMGRVTFADGKTLGGSDVSAPGMGAGGPPGGGAGGPPPGGGAGGPPPGGAPGATP